MARTVGIGIQDFGELIEEKQYEADLVARGFDKGQIRKYGQNAAIYFVPS